MTTTEPSQNDNTEFHIEQDKLAAVIQFIKDEIARLQRQFPATAAYQETANEIQRVREGLKARYEDALPALLCSR